MEPEAKIDAQTAAGSRGKKPDGGPAFPTHGGSRNENGEAFDDPRNQILGGSMTMRQWYAGMVLQGIIAGNCDTLKRADDSGVNPACLAARTAFEFADAMLAAEPAHG